RKNTSRFAPSWAEWHALSKAKGVQQLQGLHALRFAQGVPLHSGSYFLWIPTPRLRRTATLKSAANADADTDGTRAITIMRRRCDNHGLMDYDRPRRAAGLHFVDDAVAHTLLAQF